MATLPEIVGKKIRELPEKLQSEITNLYHNFNFLLDLEDNELSSSDSDDDFSPKLVVDLDKKEKKEEGAQEASKKEAIRQQILEAREREKKLKLEAELKKRKEDDAECIAELMSKGINEICLGGETVLTFALKMKNFKLARALIKAGADVNQANVLKETPFELANDLKTAHLMIEKGVDLSVMVLASQVERTHKPVIEMNPQIAEMILVMKGSKEEQSLKPLIAALAPPIMNEAHSEFHSKGLENASKHLKESASAWDSFGFSQTAAFAIHVKNKLIPTGIRVKDLVERYRCQDCELGNPGSYYWKNLFKLAPYAEKELKRLKGELRQRKQAKNIEKLRTLLDDLQLEMARLTAPLKAEQASLLPQAKEQEAGRTMTLELERRRSVERLGSSTESARKEAREGKKSAFNLD